MNFSSLPSLSHQWSHNQLHTLPLIIYIYFFSLFFFFSLLLLFFFFMKKKLWYCNCDICHAYLTSSWSKDFNNLCDWYTHLLQESPTQTVHIHVINNVITADRRNVEHILKTRFDNYPKGKPFAAILGDLLGKGIFNVDGELWFLQRKMASLQLGSVSVRSYAFENINQEIKNRLLPVLSTVAGKYAEGGVLDLQEVLRRFSFDYICKFSFGLDPSCLELALSLPISDFADSFDLATKLSAERAISPSPVIWKIKRWLNVGDEKRLRQAINKLNALAKEIIRQKRKQGFSKSQDLLSGFMRVTEKELFLRDIVISFILAGRDTVASALTCFFWVISSRPEIVTKIRSEFDRYLVPERESLEFGHLRQLNYLHAALYESMRLYPPVQFDSKFALQNDFLPDGTFVKKGKRVTYHCYAMGRIPALWGPDFAVFRPERWLKNGMFSPECPFKYPVFQGGNRGCLGKEVAFVEMKSVVVSILRRFDVEVVQPEKELRFVPGLTATVKNGLPVVVRERK